MSGVDLKREAVKRAYPGTRWALKVAKMSDRQVIATYIRLSNAKKI